MFSYLPTRKIFFSFSNHLYTFFGIGHYYGTPRPPKEALLTNGQHQYLSPTSNNHLLRRSNSANEMFQQLTTDNGIESNGKRKRIIIFRSLMHFYHRYALSISK